MSAPFSPHCFASIISFRNSFDLYFLAFFALKILYKTNRMDFNVKMSLKCTKNQRFLKIIKVFSGTVDVELSEK